MNRSTSSASVVCSSSTASALSKDVYHMNEGHAAFMSVQRLLDYVEGEGLPFDEALELVRASSIYTCHTPVPAGHDYFDEELPRQRTSATSLGVSASLGMTSSASAVRIPRATRSSP